MLETNVSVALHGFQANKSLVGYYLFIVTLNVWGQKGVWGGMHPSVLKTLASSSESHLFLL